MGATQWLTPNGQRTRRPGVFSKTDGSALAGRSPAARGTVAVLGEFNRGGEPKVVRNLSSAAALNKQLASLPETTPMGKCIFNPSDDPRVPGGANLLKLVRVNPATQASLTLVDAIATNAITVKAADYGLYGSDIQVALAAGTVLAGSKKFTATLGSLSQVVDNIAVDDDMLTVVHAGAPVGVGVALTSTKAHVRPNELVGFRVEQIVTIDQATTWSNVDAEPVAFDGKIKFDFINIEALDQTFLITGTNKATGLSATETLVIAAGAITGTTLIDYSAVTQIQVGLLPANATCTATFDAFSLLEASYDTLTKVADRVSQFSANGFTSTVDTGLTNFAITDMDDDATGQDIHVGGGHTFEAQLYWLIYRAGSGVDIVTLERATGALDIAANIAATNLTGGTNGATSSADWMAALAKLKTEQVSHVVCMTTDASVHALLKTHLDYMAGQGRDERIGWCGAPSLTALADIRTKIIALNNSNISFAAQDIKLYDYTGTATWYDPSYQALMAASADAGRVTEAGLTWASFDVLDVRDGALHPTDAWEVEEDAETLLEYGLQFFRTNVANGLWVMEADVTTYLTDDNPIFSYVYPNESANLSSKNVRRVVEAFIGTGVFTGTATSVKQRIITELQRQVDDGEIKAFVAGSVSVTDSGNGLEIGYEAAFTEELLFANITAHAIRLAASA